MSHPFGDLLSQHLHRKHGLSQAKLARGILQEPTIITKMCKGQRLNGPQARERVVAIISWLHAQGALGKLEEANALLDAASMSNLSERQHTEAKLIQMLDPPGIACFMPEAAQLASGRSLPSQFILFIRCGDESRLIHTMLTAFSLVYDAGT